MENTTPSQKKMFRLTITTRSGQMRRDRRISPEPRQPKTWLQRLGVVTAGLVLLPIALFSFAVFIGLFLSMVAAVTVYALCLRSKVKQIQSRHIVNREVVSDEDDHEKRLKGEAGTWQQS